MDGFSSQHSFSSATNSGRLGAGRTGSALCRVTGGFQKSSSGNGERGGEARLDPVWREQSAGGKGEDSVMSWPPEMAHAWPSANEQMPGCSGVIRDDPK